MPPISTLSTMVALAAALKEDPTVTEADLEHLLAVSDAANHKSFFHGDGVKDATKSVSTLFVEKYFNNPDTNEVPVRRKTKFVLVLNNFALNKSMRSSVLEALKNMTGVFEDSMKVEGTMPFDSELGRMSEHVLVLLMRVLSYKFKASQVHEFAENNTQFAVQLLLAILLKEPPYEFDLRANCIGGLLGFTQPQAFFQPTDTIELQTCDKFGDKVDFIANLMLRLQAVNVVNDVITAQMMESTTVAHTVHAAACNMMRCIMNVFQFLTKGASQWRQHVLLSTNFVDSTVLLYLQLQTKTLETKLANSLGSTAPKLSPELAPGITIALKFLAFSTFHMGSHSRCLRPLCAFAHDLLQLPIRLCLADDRLANQFAQLYSQLFHFLANTDSLQSDEGIVEAPEDLLPELTAESLRKTITGFLKAEVMGCRRLELFHAKFNAVETTGGLVAQDVASFQAIEAIFQDLLASSPPAAPSPVAASSTKKTILGDTPTVPAPAAEKKAPPPQQPVEIKQSFAAPNKVASSAAGSSGLVCALNGNTLKVPVSSPYGHTFEKETIEQWIKQQGNVCPITGKPLSLSDLKPNKELQNEVMKRVIQESLKAHEQDDEDLYDF